MGLFNIIDPVLNFLLHPLIKLGYFLGIFLISLIINLIIIFIYKKVTDQTLMKRMKDELKEFQKEMKELKSNPQKMMEVNKKAMETNMKYMMHSLKPTLYTFLPVIIIFGWLAANLAYLPIHQNEEFTVTAFFSGDGAAAMEAPKGIAFLTPANQSVVDKKVTWGIKGDAGKYVLVIKANQSIVTKDVLITDGKEYSNPVKRKKGVFDYLYSTGNEYMPPEEKQVLMVQINNKPVHPLGQISIFGWHPGWLGTYILLSIIMSILLRKLLKVY